MGTMAFFLFLISGGWILVLAFISLNFWILKKSHDTPKYLWGCGILWFPIIAFILMVIIGNTPMRRRLSPSDIYGEYRIDRGHFPGKNSEWQYSHFRFTIKPDNILILTEIDDEGKRHQYTGKVKWSDVETRRALWSARFKDKHHLRLESPTLIRSYFSFYYVIRSDKFGNMFFRKEENFLTYELGFSAILIAALVWYRLRRQRQNKLS